MAMKTKPKRKKSKAIARSPSKPLLGSDAYVRKGKNVAAANIAPFASMARMATNLMFMPMRLAACRSPFELWREQVALAHQGMVMMQSVAFGRPIVTLPLP